MTKPLAGRIALVTGASRGIGYATALALAQAGAHVVAVARTVGGLEELDDEIRAAGGSATLVPLDLRDTEGIARLGEALRERYRRLDVLIGNAGVLGPLSPLGHVEPKAWDEVIAVNVTANFHLVRFDGPAAATVGGGPGRVRHDRQHGSAARLLGSLHHLESGLEHACAYLRRGNRNDQRAREPIHPGAHPHPHARRRHAGRRPDVAQDCGRCGREDRGDVPAGFSGDRARSTTIVLGGCSPRRRRRKCPRAQRSYWLRPRSLVLRLPRCAQGDRNCCNQHQPRQQKRRAGKLQGSAGPTNSANVWVKMPGPTRLAIPIRLELAPCNWPCSLALT